MLRPRLSLTILLTATLGLAASPASANTPQELARLVPTDAFAFSQVSSIDELDRAAIALITTIEPTMAQVFDVDEVITNALQGTVDVAQLDRTKPIGVAVSLPQSGAMQPVPTFIFPVKDTKKYLQTAIVRPGQAAPLVIGDYVGVTLGSEYVVGSEPSAFVANMPQGQFAVRVDLEHLVQAFGPMIDMGLAQAEQEMKKAAQMGGPGMPAGVDMNAMADSYVQWLRLFVDSAESFDLGLAAQGSTVELTGSFTALGGSPLDGFSSSKKTALREMVRYLKPSASMSSVMSADLAAMVGHLRPFIESMATIYPEPMQQGLRGYTDEFLELFPLMGDTLVGDAEFDAHGLRLSYVFEPLDGQAVLDRYAALAGSDHVAALGVRLSGPTESVVSGLKVTEYRFERIGAEEEAAVGGAQGDVASEIYRAVYGPDARLRFVSGAGAMAMVFGGDDAYLQSTIENLKAPAGKLSPAMQHAVDAVADANPAYIASVDLARMIGQMHGLTSAMFGSGVGAGAARLASMNAPVLVYGAIEGRTWHGGFSLDLSDMVEFAEVVGGL